MRRSLAACLAASLAFPLAQAAEQIEPVVVTATRLPESAEESLASVVVIPQAEIQRAQAPDVVDLLRFHAGLEVGRNGGPGQAASVFLRGANSDQTLVLVDGVRINPGTIGGAPLQDVLPFLVQRVEVVKGPYSTLYGSDAIGGVIQIITHPEKQGTTVSAAARGGSFDTREISAAAHHRDGDLRAGLAEGTGVSSRLVASGEDVQSAAQVLHKCYLPVFFSQSFTAQRSSPHVTRGAPRGASGYRNA
jgi:vitamin B12 transporter